MPIVAGLGNVGETYVGTRHNVGFEVVSELARRWQLRWIDRGAVSIARGKFADHMVVLVQPQFLMNQSGATLAQSDIVRDADDLVVVHDDIDLPRGCVRLKVGGGTAGHRGVASMAAQFGPAFTRIRVGVGRPSPGGDVVEYVLERFTAEEAPRIEAAVQSAADAVECLLAQGREAAMLRFNTRRDETESAAAGASDRQRGEGA